jgi:hypothetical protein
MSRIFHYALEPARLAALLSEQAAGRRHLLAQDALTRSQRTLAEFAHAQVLPASAALVLPASAPAGVLAVYAGACERVRLRAEAELEATRARCLAARTVLLAARARRERLDADCARRREVQRRKRATAEARRVFEAALVARGAPGFPFETAPA